MTEPTLAIDVFERERVHLRGIAYRMTGSLADADDILQDAYLRWCKTDVEQVQQPRAFLSKLVTRLCLDQLKSARVQRESYVGPWLPEPVVDAASIHVDAATELASDISVALLLALERLSPLERAAFLLHDVFDVDYAQVAETLSRSEDACRQLAARAREHVRAKRPRHRPTEVETGRVLAGFSAAAAGNMELLSKVLAEDAVFYTDGGGRVVAATRPIFGKERILLFLEGVLRKFPLSEGHYFQVADINGLPGVLVCFGEGVVQTLAFDIVSGMLCAVYAVRNPDKLSLLRPLAEGSLGASVASDALH
jgi:RNA polymerase sigma-70 factor, ECF subfamily